MKDTFRGGVHPAERKELSRDVPLREFLPTGEMVFPLSQHIGKPAKPIVKKGEAVLVGQRIAEADGFVSAHIICSCSGKVKAIEKRRTLTGAMMECIVVENDGQFTPAADYNTRRDTSAFGPDEIFSMAAMASGLFFSMPMMPSALGKRRRVSIRPSTISAAKVRMS